MTEYDEAWMTTFTGRKFHYLNPQPDEINIVDIAHHLSLLCRFTGAVSVFYSVAEHSIRVSELVPQGLKLSALLHDAAEAYINDISRPVKYTHKLDVTEKIVMDAISRKFGITPNVPVIKAADNVLMATEARDLMANTDSWAPLPTPLPLKIVPMTSREAETMFLYRLRKYYREAQNEETGISRTPQIS